ncbi:NDP-hexose 2,3-dehydratase family protein [Rheinheimera baltica]|uniref:NDP-hexose 2,3-dehydratase family protein n=1 Tax=Rheinheimera baltica TaxID=67576 RepID=UPI00273FC1F6|nr:NDP-hexose 2,3-dehydratase family protein [Rheinheimera baltica]MDP5143059.1 NDP-hexose 2,3-dehydratase family protein [Rheinheimera baltica]MDP5189007.1 NDP-hexose 2,3-dehydratase family protein [Rheinheimera baltica]
MSNLNLIARSLADLQSFLQSVVDTANFSLFPVKLSEQDDWRLENGALSHRTNGFFHVCGIQHQVTKKTNFVLYQPQSALTGLAFMVRDGQVYVLLQARVEPGNPNVAQFGPTVQSTPANYLRLHGGKSSACVDWFTHFKAGITPLGTSMQLDLGCRYFQKSKFHNYVLLDEPVFADDTMIWASVPAVFSALTLSHFLNADLRSLLAVFDWSVFYAQQTLIPKGDERVLFNEQFISCQYTDWWHWRLAPLETVEGIELNDNGIFTNDNSSIDVQMYRTLSSTREVFSWVQPLVRAKSKGQVRLLLRQDKDDLLCLVTIAEEFGISGGRTILPTTVIYPGESATLPELPPESISHITFEQSDEGGRFIHHDSRYQLVYVNSTSKADNQFWLSITTLRQLMLSSNQVSFQLRCIFSVLLADLYPFAV